MSGLTLRWAASLLKVVRLLQRRQRIPVVVLMQSERLWIKLLSVERPSCATFLV